MRHFLANVFTYALASLLLIGSAVFAKIRSSQLVISDEASVLASFEDVPASEAAWRELGARTYEANCRHCHGREGRGWDQYPPVVGIDRLVATPRGRAYLIDLHLFGVASPRWRAPMPPMGHLPDVALAAVLDHVLTSFGNAMPAGAPPIAIDEIAARRAAGQRSPHVVDALRPRAPTAQR
jgi:mono/diheme cytochrome c family protein